MLREDVKLYLALYLGHNVQWNVENGEKQEGVFKEFGAEETLCFLDKENNECVVAVEQLEDLRYVGDVTDYHTADNTATIDEVFSFKVGDAVLRDKLFYKEFACRVNAHLKINESTHKIYAYDVALETAEHCIYEGYLLEKGYLYKINNIWEKGSLYKEDESYVLQSGALRRAIEIKEIEDITRAPKTNDIVSVEWVQQEGNQETREPQKGTVGAVNDNGFYLLHEDENHGVSHQWIAYEQMESIRYHGVITDVKGQGISSVGRIDDTYSYKGLYFDKDDLDDENKLIVENRRVSYIAGVTGKGLIAKEIYLEAIELITKYGIFVKSNNRFKTAEGETTAYYINDTYYLAKGTNTIGNALVLRENITGTVIPGEKWINVIRYEVPGLNQKDGETLRASCAEIKMSKELDADVVEVCVTEEGELKEYRLIDRLNVKAYWKRFENKEGAVYRRNQQSMLRGKLVRYDEKTKELCLIVGGRETWIAVEEIEKICLYGKIGRPDKFKTGENGLIGDDLFFRLNDAGAIQNTLDEMVMYELGVSKAGDGFYAYNVKPVLTTERYYIIAYVDAEDKYVLLSETDYVEGNYGRCKKMSSENYVNVADLKNKDYLVEAEAVKENGNEKLRNVTVLSECEKDKYKIGCVEKYIPNPNGKYYGFVNPWAGERWEEKGIYFSENMFVTEKYQFNTFENVYEVLFRETENGDDKKAKILQVLKAEPKQRVSGKQKPTEFNEGETICYREGKNIHIGSYSETKDGKIYAYFDGEDAEAIPAAVKEVVRFGILAYDKYKEKYYLSNREDKKVYIDSKKMYTELMLKTEKAKELLIQYSVRVEDNTIVEVKKVDKAMLNQLVWKESKVVKEIKETESASRVLVAAEDGTGEETYYLTTDNQVVNSMRGKLEDESVYVRRVTIPTGKEDEPLRTVIADAAMKTFAAKKVEFASVKGVYKYVAILLGTNRVELADENVQMLERVAASEGPVPITFRIDENMPNVLNAYLQEGVIEAEWEAIKEKLGKIVDDIAAERGKEKPDSDKIEALYEEYCYLLYRTSDVMPNREEGLYRLFAMEYYYGNKNDSYLKMQTEDFGNTIREIVETISVKRTLSHIVNISDEACTALIEALGEDAKALQTKTMNALNNIFIGGSEQQETVTLKDVVDKVRKLYSDIKEELSGKRVFEVLERVVSESRKGNDADFWYLLRRFETGRLEKLYEWCQAEPAELNTNKEVSAAIAGISNWKEAVKKCPSAVAGEVSGKVLDERVKELGKRRIQIEAQKIAPQLCFGVFDAGIFTAPKRQKRLLIYIQNGKNTENDKPVKEAMITQYTVYLHGQQIAKEIGVKLLVKQNEGLAVDNRVVLETAIPDAFYELDKEAKTVPLKLEVEYTYTENETTKTIHEQLKSEDGKDEIILQLTERPWSQEVANSNPYGTGDALAEDSDMFFGRATEINDCINSLVNATMEEGKWIYTTKRGVFSYLYGQKRCGKSSVLNQVFSEKERKLFVRDEQKKPVYLADSLVMKYPGPDKILPEASATEGLYLRLFTSYLCDSIANVLCEELKREMTEDDIKKALDESAAKRSRPLFQIEAVNTAIRMMSQGTRRLLKKADSETEGGKPKAYVEGDEYAYLSDVKSLFDKTDKQKRAIIVVIDEFTELCIRIKEQMKWQPEAIKCLAFIKKFRDMGISIVLSGHERMVELFTEIANSDNSDLINDTTGKASAAVPILELSDDDAKDLIVIPMERRLNAGKNLEEEQHKPYATKSGKEAIAKLKALSGNNPYFLTMLLKELYTEFAGGRCGYYISETDVEDVKNTFVEGSIGDSFDTVYDALLFAKGDSALMKQDLLQALTLIAEYSNSAGVCQLRDIEKPFSSKQDMAFEALLETLVGRKVIERTEKNTYRIKVPIFSAALKKRSERIGDRA